MASNTATGEDCARAAEFIAFNINGLNNTAQDTLMLLTKKAIALAKDDQMEGWMLEVKANLYQSTGNLKKLEAITKERIAHIKRHPSDDTDKEVQRIEEEFERYQKALAY